MVAPQGTTITTMSVAQIGRVVGLSKECKYAIMQCMFAILRWRRIVGPWPAVSQNFKGRRDLRSLNWWGGTIGNLESGTNL